MKKLPLLIAVVTLFSLHLTAYAEENAAKQATDAVAKPAVTEQADAKPSADVVPAADGEKKAEGDSAPAPTADGEKKAEGDSAPAPAAGSEKKKGDAEPDCN